MRTALLRFTVALLVSALVEVQAGEAPSITVTPIDSSAIRPALPPGPLILPLEVDIVAARDFIRLGFGLDQNVRFQSTQLLTPRLRTVQAQQLINLITSYNNFDGKKVANALSEFRGKVSGIEFGREGSPVLYIDLPYWTHQREETAPTGMGEKIPDSQNEQLVRRLRQVFVDSLAADEFYVDLRRVRIWWD